jgi:hypothetical protein
MLFCRALLSFSVAAQAHQLISERYLLYCHNWINQSIILGNHKVSHSVEITSWIRYVDNTHTLSQNMKFIYIYKCTSFRNVKKREHYTSLSDLFHGDWKYIIYFPPIYIYCIYHVMSKTPQTTVKLSKKRRNKRRSYRVWLCPLWSPRL